MDAFDRLVSIVRRLRGPDGCDWDRAQTPETMRGYLLEEAFEVVDAIDRGAPGDLAGELGDLTFLVLLLGRMHEERGDFAITDPLERVADKMVHRHPHVFGDARERPSWESFKRQEPGRTSLLDGLPAALPALLRAQRVGERAAEVGFDWPDATGVRAKVDEELAELDAAVAQGGSAEVAEELGDLLFALTNLARHHGLRAEDVLRAATTKFECRFRTVEALAAADGATLAGSTPATLDAWWRAAKEALA